MKRKISIKSVVLAFVLVYVCFVLIQQQVTMGRQKQEFEEYNVEIQKKKEESRILQDEFRFSKTEPDKYIEKIAREKLGLVKEGETPVMDNKN